MFPMRGYPVLGMSFIGGSTSTIAECLQQKSEKANSLLPSMYLWYPNTSIKAIRPLIGPQALESLLLTVFFQVACPGHWK